MGFTNSAQLTGLLGSHPLHLGLTLPLGLLLASLSMMYLISTWH